MESGCTRNLQDSEAMILGTFNIENVYSNYSIVRLRSVKHGYTKGNAAKIR
jgi:hypothetical protein